MFVPSILQRHAFLNKNEIAKSIIRSQDISVADFDPPLIDFHLCSNLQVSNDAMLSFLFVHSSDPVMSFRMQSTAPVSTLQYEQCNFFGHSSLHASTAFLCHRIILVNVYALLTLQVVIEQIHIH